MKTSRDWSLIYDSAQAARKPETDVQRFDAPSRDFFKTALPPMTAANIIRNRRSAVDFDPDGSMPKASFLGMLDKTLVRRNVAPFDVDLGQADIDLLIFVHAVEGLDSGLYYLLRDEARLAAICKNTRPEFLWQPVDNGFPLYVLDRQNYRQEAKTVSCHQAIAGDGIFSLGMIARFRKTLVRQPFRYRHLFWEAGMIGQVLYLEAEAHGVRGTGIGCFFRR